MSKENVELVRRLYDAHGGPELRPVAEVVLDPEIEWHPSEGFGVLRGRESVLEHFQGFSETFERWRVVADELIDAGDEVVAVTLASGTGATSGVDLDARYAIVFTVRSGLIVCGREYATRSEALEAVGLAE